MEIKEKINVAKTMREMPLNTPTEFYLSQYVTLCGTRQRLRTEPEFKFINWSIVQKDGLVLVTKFISKK